MKHWIMLTLLAVSALTMAVGCDDQASQGPAAAGSAAAPAALKDEDLPTPADFDDEAAKQINAGNYKTELDALDKEIAAE